MTTRTAPKPTELPAAKLKWRCELSRIPSRPTAQAELREVSLGRSVHWRAGRWARSFRLPLTTFFVCGLAAPAAVERSPA